MTIAAYQTLYESSIAFGMRKALMAEQGKVDLQQKTEQLEAECRDLEHQVSPTVATPLISSYPNEQVMELRNKCDAIEKTEAEKRQLSEKKHQEELQALRKTNQQLKVPGTYSICVGCHYNIHLQAQLEGVIAPQKK